MLSDHAALATVPVRDFAAALDFYGRTLGLHLIEQDDRSGVATFRTGPTALLVYRTDLGGANPATSATWGVGAQFDAIAARLEDAGVLFEEYEIPGLQVDGGIHSAGDFKAIWFRDPDGNILHVNNQ